MYAAWVEENYASAFPKTENWKNARKLKTALNTMDLWEPFKTMMGKYCNFLNPQMRDSLQSVIDIMYAIVQATFRA